MLAMLIQTEKFRKEGGRGGGGGGFQGTNFFLIASNCSINSLVLSSIDKIVRNASLSDTTWPFTIWRISRCDLRLDSCWENICAYFSVNND